MSEIITYDQLVPHPLAAKFPPLSPQEYAELKASIARLGLIDPIVQNSKGQILAGNTRYKIAKELGLDLKACCLHVEEILGGRLSDATAQEHRDRIEAQYIFDSNIHRRNLTNDQRAAIATVFLPELRDKAAAARMAGQIKGGEIHAQASSELNSTPSKNTEAKDARSTVGQLAEKAGVSRHKAALAKAVHDKAPEELDKVRKGEKSLTQAAAKLKPKKRTKKFTIPDPLGGFVHTLRQLKKKPIEHYAAMAATVKEEPEAEDLYNICYDGIEPISTVLDTLEVTFPNLKGTRE